MVIFQLLLCLLDFFHYYDALTCTYQVIDFKSNILYITHWKQTEFAGSSFAARFTFIFRSKQSLLVLVSAKVAMASTNHLPSCENCKLWLVGLAWPPKTGVSDGNQLNLLNPGSDLPTHIYKNPQLSSHSKTTFLFCKAKSTISTGLEISPPSPNLCCML